MVRQESREESVIAVRRSQTLSRTSNGAPNFKAAVVKKRGVTLAYLSNLRVIKWCGIIEKWALIGALVGALCDQSVIKVEMSSLSLGWSWPSSIQTDRLRSWRQFQCKATRNWRGWPEKRQGCLAAGKSFKRARKGKAVWSGATPPLGELRWGAGPRCRRQLPARGPAAPPSPWMALLTKPHEGLEGEWNCPPSRYHICGFLSTSTLPSAVQCFPSNTTRHHTSWL